MAIYSPETTQTYPEDAYGDIRSQLEAQEGLGIATQDLTVEPIHLNIYDGETFKSLAPPDTHINDRGRVDQDLVAVADTGRTLFGVVRAEVRDRIGSKTELFFLTEMSRDNSPGSTSELRYVFDPHSKGYVQPIDEGKPSRLQLRLTEDGLLARNTPTMTVDSSKYIDGNPVHFTVGFGEALADTTSATWAVNAEHVQDMASL